MKAHTDNPITPLTVLLRSGLDNFVLVAAILLLVILAGSNAFAGSATWASFPQSGNWGFPGNWSPATVPNGSGDTATFVTSNTANVSLSATTEVNGIVFNSGMFGATAFTITASATTTNTSIPLTISGVGITNNSGIAQNFVTAAATQNPGQAGEVIFRNSATAGNGTVFTQNGVTSGVKSGVIIFLNTSTAGNGTFINNGSALFDASGGSTQFNDTSTAANGIFTNNGATVSGAGGGFTMFNGAAVAPTAANGTFTNNGGAVSGATGGVTLFFNTSTAGNGIFTINGGAVSGAFGGQMVFFDTSTAGSATLIANGGLGGGGGGLIQFQIDSTGGTARVEVFGNGNLDISGHNAPGVTIGSIEGSGLVFLGADNLSVGSNNLSTTFSGAIQDGGINGGTGGSLTKIGKGKLSLTKANTYTGGTAISKARSWSKTRAAPERALAPCRSTPARSAARA